MIFNINDDTLEDFLVHKYGLTFSKAEIEEIYKWYRENESSLDEDNVDRLFLAYVRKTYPSKRIKLLEDDSSNLNYLLLLLKKNSGK